MNLLCYTHVQQELNRAHTLHAALIRLYRSQAYNSRVKAEC